MSEGDELGPIGHPIERKAYDHASEQNWTKPGAYAPRPDPMRTPSDDRTPAQMMRAMGFDPTKNMTPLQFLVAVYNNELGLIFKNEKRRILTETRGGIALSSRIEAAKVAAKYMHQQLPNVTILDETKGGYGEGLSSKVAKADERVRTRRVIIEEVDRISPQVPLPAASYPPDFEPDIEAQGEEVDDEE